MAQGMDLALDVSTITVRDFASRPQSFHVVYVGDNQGPVVHFVFGAGIKSLRRTV